MSRHNKNSEFLLFFDIILIHGNIIMLRYNFNSLSKIVIFLRQLFFKSLILVLLCY